jgi:surfactin synthase thioesterase subunit
LYRAWPALNGDIEFCPVQLPGRENRFSEPSFTTYDELAPSLLHGLAEYLDRPFAFFGHCGSALIGFEATRQLIEMHGPRPVRLFVSSQVAPHEGPFGRFLQMNDAELRDEVRLLMRRLRGAQEPEEDLVELCLGVLRQDVAANKRYFRAVSTHLGVPITAIGWQSDNEIRADQMRGWAEWSETEFRILPGEHHRFLEAPPELLGALVEDMRGAIRHA